VTQGSNRNLSMTDPLITMAELPSQASCKEFSRLCPAASYRQIVENGQGGKWHRFPTHKTDSPT